jgi:transposase-like protein
MMSDSSRGKRYSPKFKFNVVLEVLESDRSVPEIARSYDVHPNTVYNWKETFLENGSEVFGGDEQMKEYEDKIDELEHLLGKKEVELALAKNFLNEH